MCEKTWRPRSGGGGGDADGRGRAAAKVLACYPSAPPAAHVQRGRLLAAAAAAGASVNRSSFGGELLCLTPMLTFHLRAVRQTGTPSKRQECGGTFHGSRKQQESEEFNSIGQSTLDWVTVFIVFYTVGGNRDQTPTLPHLLLLKFFPRISGAKSSLQVKSSPGSARASDGLSALFSPTSFKLSSLLHETFLLALVQQQSR